jgi:hypothetical protein
VGDRAEDQRTITHPTGGAITVDCDLLSAGSSDLKIVLLTAAGGSEDADQIARVRASALGHPS